jgi:hypothetical protein
MVSETNEILSNEELININTRGTHYFMIKFDPITDTIITIDKHSRGNGGSEPIKRTLKQFISEIYLDREILPDVALKNEKVLSRVKLSMQ